MAITTISCDPPGTPVAVCASRSSLTPFYVDVAVKRWQAFTGKHATLLSTGQTFEQVASERAAAPEPYKIEKHVEA